MAIETERMACRSAANPSPLQSGVPVSLVSKLIGGVLDASKPAHQENPRSVSMNLQKK
jgi:hypothetical protein